MQFATDELVARVLLTLLIAGTCFVPALFDFNRTHATNPMWTAHARFHVVWQISSYIGLGLVALYLLWSGGDTANLRLWIVMALVASIFGGFAAAVIFMPRYGGGLADPNGVPPFGTRVIAGRSITFDTNATLFSGFGVLLLIAVLSAAF